MQHTRAVLRRATVERHIRGDERSRDAAIEQFLEELQTLFTPTLIQHLRDEVVSSMYEDWLRALPHLTQEQRLEALALDTRLCSAPFLMYRKGHTEGATLLNAPAAPADNVVSLHAR